MSVFGTIATDEWSNTRNFSHSLQGMTQDYIKQLEREKQSPKHHSKNELKQIDLDIRNAKNALS